MGVQGLILSFRPWHHLRCNSTTVSHSAVLKTLKTPFLDKSTVYLTSGCQSSILPSSSKYFYTNSSSILVSTAAFNDLAPCDASYPSLASNLHIAPSCLTSMMIRPTSCCPEIWIDCRTFSCRSSTYLCATTACLPAEKGRKDTARETRSEKGFYFHL